MTTTSKLDRKLQILIKDFGYVDLDAEHYIFVGDYFKILLKGVHAMEEILDPIKIKFMTPEERKKYLVVKESQRIYAEEER